MTKVLQINGVGWSEHPTAETLPGAGPALEGGDVLFLPALPFAVEPSEALLFTSRVGLPTGSTWLAFTDQVSHAATAGQYQLEQAFLLPVEAMAEPERSPLRVLESLKQRRLT
jgi:hypothetical protein